MTAGRASRAPHRAVRGLAARACGGDVRIVRQAIAAVGAVALAAGCATAPAPASPVTAAPPSATPAAPPPPASPADGTGPAPATPVTVEDSARAALAGRRLLVPVAGVDAARIPDTFLAPRGARTHGALDIMAPRGTPVLSADEGVVLRVSENRAGGLTIYVADPERRLVYYYAHMDRYARDIAAGRPVARGDTLGFVGTTGNAPRDIPHLHFQVMLMHPEGRYWAGTPVNPLPLLRSAATTAADEPDE
ncbi:MAG TPA: M23 family metallopeptidase [Gemmatimonadaceae bacterium]|nr:M23 family metallopeptidase [Gemmatimonadaceae bacterium]